MTHYHLFLDLLLTIAVWIYGGLVIFAGFRGMWKRRPVYIINQGIRTHLLVFGFWTIYFASFMVEYIEIDNRITIGHTLIILLVSAIFFFVLNLLPYFRKPKSESELKVTIHGVNNKVLELLRRAFVKEGINFEERPRYYYLPDHNSIVTISAWGIVGYAAIKFHPEEKLPIWEKIILDMKEYDDGHYDHYSIIFMILQILLGMAIIGVALTNLLIFLK